MAELVYRVATDWKEVERLYNEIMKLNAALEKSNTDSPRAEISSLISKLDELKSKYAEIIQTTQQANEKLSVVFKDSSSENPYKGLEDNAEKASKTLNKSFDDVISKVCELYDYIKETKDLIGSLTESSDVITKITDCISELSNETKRQELNLSNQAAQNTNILQQQQAGVMSMTQQNVQAQSLNEAASERAAIEEEVKTSIDDTTSSIKEQTNVVLENTDAIKEQKQETAEIGDEFSDAFQSEERAINDKIEALKQLNQKLQESIANSSSDEERSRYENQYAINEAEIKKLEDSLDRLSEKEEKAVESGNKFSNVKRYIDELGKSFVVWGDSAEDARQRAEFAKEVMISYKDILQQINDLPIQFKTSESNELIKEAEEIGEKLKAAKSTADMFDQSGAEVGGKMYERLLNIKERLEEINEEERKGLEEREKLEKLALQKEKDDEERAKNAGTMRTRIMKAREEMIQLIEAGKKGTPEFMELAEKAGDMREEMQLANAYMSYFDDPNRGLTTLKVGLQGVAGAASLVTSTIGLFNEDSKKMIEIQTKVQSILGIVVGLETTYNLVKRTSVFMIALEEVKTWALAKARGVQAAATTAATAAQEGLNAAMSKTPWGAIVAILVTLGTAIFAVTKALMSETEAEKKAREEKEAHIKAIKEQQEKWAQSVAESASKQIMSYKELQKKWNELGNDMAKKKKFIKDNQTAFHNLGMSVNGVSDAENLLVKNTDAVVDSIMARAKALAYQELMTDSYKKQIEEQMKADQKNASVEGGQYSYRVKAGGNATDRRNKAYQNARAAGYTFMEGDTKDGKWTEQGARRLNQYNSNYAAQQRAKAAEEDKKRNKKYDDEQKKLLKKTEEELEKEKKRLANAGIKTYDQMTDKKDKEKSGGSGKTAAEKAQEQRELMDKQKREQIRAAEDLEFSTREARIKAMEESSAKVLAQIELNHDKEVKAIERAYEDMRIKRVEAAKQLWEKDEKNKGKNFFESQEYSNSLYNSAEETENLKARLDAAAKQRQQALKEESDRQIQALLDYQKAYGDFQTQREAIAKEYDLKIDKEQDTIQKAALQRQKERLISELNMKELQQSLDWETVFNNLEYQSVEALQSLKEQLARALDVKDITAENAKVLAEKIREIEDSIARKTDIWSSWIPGLRERKRLSLEILEVNKQIEGLTTARNTAGASQGKAISKFTSVLGVSEGAFRQQYQKVNNGNLEDIKEAYKEQIESSDAVREAFEELETTTINLSKSEEELKQARENRERRQDAFKNFTKGGSVSQYFKDVTAGMDAAGIFGLVNQNAQSANNLINNIGLGNTEFGKGFAEFAEGMQGFQNGIQSLMQGDVFGAINGVVDGIQGFGDAIGRAFGINWSGGNEKEHAEREKELIKANEGLQRSIDKLTEAFNNANGVKAIQLSEDIIKKQQEFNDNVMARWENDMGYHSAHHSNAANWEGFSQAQINLMNALLAQMDAKYGDAKDRNGKTARINSSSWRELTNLTPEALDYIRAYLPDIWDFITSRGDYAWVYDSLNEYADLTGKIAEQTEALTENLSQLSSTALHDQFLSDLMDMDKKANDFGKDFTNILAKAVLNAQIGDLMDEELKNFREEIAGRMKKAGGLTKDDVNDLREMWNSIVQAGITARNNMVEITGYTGKDSQTATGKSLDKISYTQADSLVGIATAQQITQEQSRDRLDMLNAKADQMYMTNIEVRDIAADSRDILAGMAIHVEEIRDGMVDTLVPAIKDMRSDLEKVRKLVEEQ